MAVKAEGNNLGKKEDEKCTGEIEKEEKCIAGELLKENITFRI